MSTYRLAWKYSGKLSFPKKSLDSGIYVFIYENTHCRVIYVGTVQSKKGFRHRWDEHLSLFDNGGRTIWRPDLDEDVYSLMSQKNSNESNYRELCEIGKVWIPGNVFDDVNKHYLPLFEKSPSFPDFWRPYIINEYLERINVWQCNIKDNKLARVLESQIQTALGNRFKLTYYRKAKQNWLGKIEKNIEEISDYHFEFKQIFNADCETLHVMNDLSKYLKDEV